MRDRLWIPIAAVLLCCTPALRGQITVPKLSLAPDDTSVYAPPAPPREDEGINTGGVNLDFNFRYANAYVYRGINHNDVGGHKNAPNLQFDGTLNFNLGKLPHPFVGVFVNVYDSDPLSRFQEIRPFFGVEWTIRPLTFAGGHTSYIYPEREDFNTSEVWGRITLDDSYFLNNDTPLLSPYIFYAYDYSKNKGSYFEAGIKHEFPIEDMGLTITLLADVAYDVNIKQSFVFVHKPEIGWQHYDVGANVSYSLNTLFNFPTRFGQWSLNGYVYYTSGIASHESADRLFWGGAGIGFHY